MTQRNVCNDGIHENDAPLLPLIGSEGKVVSVVLEFEGVNVTVTPDTDVWSRWIDMTTGFRYGQTLRGGFVRVG